MADDFNFMLPDGLLESDSDSDGGGDQSGDLPAGFERGPSSSYPAQSRLLPSLGAGGLGGSG